MTIQEYKMFRLHELNVFKLNIEPKTVEAYRRPQSIVLNQQETIFYPFFKLTTFSICLQKDYMKVSRRINLSNVSNLLHPAGFQQQIWLGKVSWIWDVCQIYNRQHKWYMTVSGWNFAKSSTTCLGQV